MTVISRFVAAHSDIVQSMPSLLLVNDQHDEHVRAEHQNLLWVAWDDVKAKLGRVTRIENGRIVYVPPQAAYKRCFATELDQHSAAILLGNAGARMFRGAGSLRAPVPPEVVAYEKYWHMILAVRHDHGDSTENCCVACRQRYVTLPSDGEHCAASSGDCKRVAAVTCPLCSFAWHETCALELGVHLKYERVDSALENTIVGALVALLMEFATIGVRTHEFG